MLLQPDGVGVAPSPNASAIAEVEDRDTRQVDLRTRRRDALEGTPVMALNQESTRYLVARCEHVLEYEPRSRERSPEGLIETANARQVKLNPCVAMQDYVRIVKGKVALKVASVPMGSSSVKRRHIPFSYHQPRLP